MPYPRKNRKEIKERSLEILKSSGSLSAYLADACIGTLLKDENVDSVLAISSVGSPNRILDQYPPAIRNQLAEFAEMMVEWGSTRGVMGLIERIKKYQKPVILAAPPTSREESEAIREFEKTE